MKLGVNVVRLTRSFTGVGRYIECLLDEWSRMAHPFAEIVLYTHTAIDPARVVYPKGAFREEVVGRPMADPLWEWRTLPGLANDMDVLFCPSYTVPPGYRGRKAVTYHGPSQNVPWTREWWRSQIYNQLYKSSARRAEHVFTCSGIVKRRVVEVFGVAPERVSVTFMAPSASFKPISDTALLDETRRRHTGSDRPFILFVGKMARRHYIPNLLEAFAAVCAEKQPPHNLLLVGPDYLGLDIPARARKLGVGDRVIHRAFINHQDLPPVYNAADLFIFPASEAEGFGIPPIEAMACGTPTITTNQGSLREFAPGAALLTETSSTADLQAALARLIFDEELKAELRIKGLERASQITWEHTARKTMDALWRLANS